MQRCYFVSEIARFEQPFSETAQLTTYDFVCIQSAHVHSLVFEGANQPTVKKVHILSQTTAY